MVSISINSQKNYSIKNIHTHTHTHTHTHIYIILIFNKPINESHMYTIVFGKNFDLVTNGSFIMITPLNGQKSGWESNW